MVSKKLRSFLTTAFRVSFGLLFPSVLPSVIYVTRTQVWESGASVNLGVQCFKLKNKGYVDMHTDLDTGSEICQIIFFVIIFLSFFSIF